MILVYLKEKQERIFSQVEIIVVCVKLPNQTSQMQAQTVHQAPKYVKMKLKMVAKRARYRFATVLAVENLKISVFLKEKPEDI
jgi:hypothetical protein